MVLKELAVAFKLRSKDLFKVHGYLARNKGLIVGGNDNQLVVRLEEFSIEAKLST